jgi:hypothetical protein
MSNLMWLHISSMLGKPTLHYYVAWDRLLGETEQDKHKYITIEVKFQENA